MSSTKSLHYGPLPDQLFLEFLEVKWEFSETFIIFGSAVLKECAVILEKQIKKTS